VELDGVPFAGLLLKIAAGYAAAIVSLGFFRFARDA